MMCKFARAVVTEYHKLRSLNNRDVLSRISISRRPEPDGGLKLHLRRLVTAGWVLLRICFMSLLCLFWWFAVNLGHLLTCPNFHIVFSLCPQYFFYKDTSILN